MAPSTPPEPQATQGNDELAEAVLGRDVVALFENAYAAYAGEAHRAALRVLRDPDLADDAVHAAFVELLRYVLAGKRWYDPGDARRAILRNAHWAALKIVRARRTRPEVSLHGAAEAAAEDPGWARAEARAVCGQIVGRLRPAQQEALDLHFVQGLTATQCATRLGITTGAFEARLHRAVRSARRSARAIGVLGIAGLALRAALGRVRTSPRPAARLMRAPVAALGSAASVTAVLLAAGAVTGLSAPATPPARPVLARTAQAPAPTSAPPMRDTPQTSTIVDTLRLPGGAVLLLGEGRTCSCGLVFVSRDGRRTWQTVALPTAVVAGDRLAVTGGNQPTVFISRRDGSSFTSPELEFKRMETPAPRS
jgi:RNA polymerase sigma-70 factor, ECF subfamily